MQRGVIVNVLLVLGIGYSWHKSDRALKKLGVNKLPAIFTRHFRLTGQFALSI